MVRPPDVPHHKDTVLHTTTTSSYTNARDAVSVKLTPSLMLKIASFRPRRCIRQRQIYLFRRGTTWMIGVYRVDVLLQLLALSSEWLPQTKTVVLFTISAMALSTMKSHMIATSYRGTACRSDASPIHSLWIVFRIESDCDLAFLLF